MILAIKSLVIMALIVNPLSSHISISVIAIIIEGKRPLIADTAKGTVKTAYGSRMGMNSVRRA